MTVSPPAWVMQTPSLPGLHNPALFGPPGQVPNAQQWFATISALVEYSIGEVAIAFGGIQILGWKPFAFLQTWGENLQQQAQDAFDGQQTANLNLATLLDGVMGTGHTFSDLASFLSTAASLASTVNTEFGALLSGLGADNVSTLVSYLSTASGNALAAADAWADATAAAAVADAAALGTALAGAASNAQGMIDTVVQTAQNDAALVGQTLATAGDQLVALFSSAPQQLQGFLGAFGVQGFIDALGAHKANTQATQTQVVSVASALNTVAAPAGVDETIDFTGIADQTDMSGVMLPGTGDMGITGGQAVLQTSGASDIEAFPTEAGDDYVVIETTLGSLNDLAVSQGLWSGLICRANSALDTYTEIYILSEGPFQSHPGRVDLQIDAVVSGTRHNIGTVAFPSAAQDGIVKIIVGDRLASNPYVFEVLYNGSVVLGPTTDSSHFSQIGAGQRYVGLMMASSFGGIPPGIKKVRYYDNGPSAGDRPYAQTPPNNAQTPGGLYIPSDTGLVRRDNGTSWDNVLGGPLAVFTEPPSTGWTAVNQGSTTFAADKDAMLLTAPSVASGESYHPWVRTLSPASGYSAELYLECLGAPTSTWITSIVLRESSSGKLVTFDVGVDVPDAGVGLGDSTSAFMAATKRTGPSGFSASYKTAGIRYFGGLIPHWMRVRDDGANRYFEYSYNGVDWMTFHSVGRTDFCVPDQIGVSAFNLATGQPVTLRIRSLDGIA